MSSNDGSQTNPPSVLVPRTPSEPVPSAPSRPFRFSIPSLSKAGVQPELPDLFQVEKQAKSSNIQPQPEQKQTQIISNPPQNELKQTRNDARRFNSENWPAAASASKQSVVPDPNCILVSRRQEKNTLLHYIRNVRWKFADGDSLLCDYLVGNSACVLYLTLRYHMQCPEYIHARMGPLKHAYRLRVLLILVDMEDVGSVIEDLTRVAFINNWTMVCAFSIQEAAQYIETFKAQENAPFDSIKERIESDHASIFSSVLTLIRSVNKTDVVTLAQAFGSLSNIMAASIDELSQCPGIGTLKAARIYEAFHQPFRQER